MKLKGVNPIEQHIEKIVLGIMVLLLLGVLAMQFVMRPNDVKVGSAMVGPGQIYTALERQAEQVNSQLTDFDPALPEVASVNLVERYNAAFENASGGSVELSAALGTPVDVRVVGGNSIADVVVSNDGPVSALIVPRTSTPVAASQWATLDPYAVLEVPAYEAFVPAAQPYDFASVSIEAFFSGKELQDALNGQGGSGDAIPRRFWSSTGFAVLGFEAQRQQLMSDGSWGASEPIVTPPMTPMPTKALLPESGLLDLAGLVSTASRVIDEVARPQFPPTIAGEQWVPPSERVEFENESESSEITRIRRQLDRARAELDRLNAAPAAPRPGGKRTTTGPRNAPNTDRNRARIDQLRERIDELTEQLNDLGVDTDDTSTSRPVRTSSNDVRSILEVEEVGLWAHDLGVEPGATYRYRTRVVVNNPLFRKGGELDPDDAAQQALTQDPFVRGDWSSWSEQVTVGAEEYYFVASAETENQFGNPEAKTTLDLFKMYYGYYRKSSMIAMPGDAISTNVRVSDSLLMFDTGVIEADDAARAIAAQNDDQDDQPTAPALPEGVSRLPNRVTISLGAYVLEVYSGLDTVETALGRTVIPMQVVIRDPMGNLVVRADISDQSSAGYLLASASASQASDAQIRAPGQSAIPSAFDLFKPVEP
tara:strand:+ start:1541 stop:3496 length:1956 start_codon:yes stop_codon:yes gene_type:complete